LAAKTKEKEEKPKAHPLMRAWAAGIVDGKLTFPKEGMYIRMDSKNKALLDQFAEVTNCGTVVEQKRPDINFTNYVWQCTNADGSRTVLLLVAPFLSATTLKKAAALIAKIERSAHWIKKHPEKAALSVTGRAANAEAQTPPPSTQADGPTASPVDETTETPTQNL
jgi:hypothetical protein